MSPPAPPPPAPRRSSLPFVLGVAAVLLALPVGYVAFLSQPPAVEDPAGGGLAAADAGPVAAHPLELTLREAEGDVQVRRGAGPWEPASPGVALRASDAVRTGDGALAVLVGGEEVEVRLEPGTEVSVEELTDSLSRVLLGGGMATTRVRGAAGARHTFEVRAAGSDAVARTDGGVFTMSSNGEGTVAVGTAEGEVQLRGAGKVVIVRAGQGSLVRPGQAPEAPAPLPASLLLKVQWPAATTVRQRRLRVAGQAEPGAHVEVAGHVVRADAQGRFAYELPLREGQQRVQVRAVGAGGRRDQLQQDVTVDTTPPRVGIDPGLWK